MSEPPVENAKIKEGHVQHPKGTDSHVISYRPRHREDRYHSKRSLDDRYRSNRFRDDSRLSKRVGDKYHPKQDGHSKRLMDRDDRYHRHRRSNRIQEEESVCASGEFSSPEIKE
jgi:hypothetical protein